MNQPWIYMYFPSQSPFPPPSLPSPSGSSQCTRPEHLSHASVTWPKHLSHVTCHLSSGPSTCHMSHGLVICFTIDNIHVSMLFLATPWTAAYQAPPSMGFSRQEDWSGMPLPSPFKRYMHLNVHCSTIYNSQDMEVT